MADTTAARTLPVPTSTPRKLGMMDAARKIKLKLVNCSNTTVLLYYILQRLKLTLCRKRE